MELKNHARPVYQAKNPTNEQKKQQQNNDNSWLFQMKHEDMQQSGKTLHCVNSRIDHKVALCICIRPSQFAVP